MARLLWVPLLYLAFMIPLPNFIETRLTTGLMLLSSEIGVAVIRDVHARTGMLVDPHPAVGIGATEFSKDSGRSDL